MSWGACSYCGTNRYQSIKMCCVVCTNQKQREWDEKSNELERMWDEKNNELLRKWNEKNKKPDFFQSRLLKFLGLRFESEPADEIRKGDVIIVVQGKSEEPLYAHKFVLSSRSPVFSKMFHTKMQEEESGTVHTDDTTLPVMRAVIKFCYDGEINFTDQVTGEDALATAHKYDIALLQKICEEHLIETLNNGNLASRLKLSKKFEVLCLEVAASKYLKDHFDDVIGDVLTELCT